MEIYITCFLQILSFSRRFRRYEMKKKILLANHGGQQYIIIGSPPLPQEFLTFLRAWRELLTSGVIFTVNR